MPSINDYYRDVVEAVVEKRPFGYFFYYLYIYTDDKLGADYMGWVDYLLDTYLQYRSCGFTPMESEINAIMGGLEVLLEGEK